MVKEPPPLARSGYRPDFRFGNTIVEVKSDLHSFRNLRAALLQLAYYLTEQPSERGLLVLANPRITDAALRKEWRLAEQTLRPDILRRLSVAAERGEEISTISGELAPGLRKSLRGMVDREARAQPARARQPSEAIFLVLLLEWLRRKGPMTTRYLMQAVGCSYPTVASALSRLGNSVRRFSDRRIQLWGFPSEEWQRVVANLGRVHPTLHYADRSGQRRSAESLLRRASGLDRGDIAVGGVLAARHYYPELDLRGTPRLDLTLHSPDGSADLSFVEHLDPALERTDKRDEPAALAVHVLRRPASFFEPGGDGLPWADPVESLLGMYDARLEPQARQFLDFLVTSVG